MLLKNIENGCSRQQSDFPDVAAGHLRRFYCLIAFVFHFPL